VTVVNLYYDCPACPAAPRKDDCHVTAVTITVTVSLDFDKLVRSPQEEIGAPRCPICTTLATYGGSDLPSGDDGESR